MASLHTLKTHLRISLGGIAEHEVEARVSYWFTRAWPQSSMDPGSDATVEIDNIQIANGRDYHSLPGWLVDSFRDDETLIADCMADKAESDEYARDQAADARREEMMLGRRP